MSFQIFLNSISLPLMRNKHLKLSSNSNPPPFSLHLFIFLTVFLVSGQAVHLLEVESLWRPIQTAGVCTEGHSAVCALLSWLCAGSSPGLAVAQFECMDYTAVVWGARRKELSASNQRAQQKPFEKPSHFSGCLKLTDLKKRTNRLHPSFEGFKCRLWDGQMLVVPLHSWDSWVRLYISEDVNLCIARLGLTISNSKRFYSLFSEVLLFLNKLKNVLFLKTIYYSWLWRKCLKSESAA